MYICFVKGSGCMGTRFDNPELMGKWIDATVGTSQSGKRCTQLIGDHL